MAFLFLRSRYDLGDKRVCSGYLIRRFKAIAIHVLEEDIHAPFLFEHEWQPFIWVLQPLFESQSSREMLSWDIKPKILNHLFHSQCLLRTTKHRNVIVTSESISILHLASRPIVCSCLANMARKRLHLVIR